MTLSITIIGHNEADHLQELLPQLTWPDEVIYVDCESGDGSLEIAREHGCLTFSRPNDRNLNINKSFAMDQASGDWIFYLDPDERIPSELAQEIQDIINSESKFSAFRLRRKNHYFGKWLKYGSQYPDIQLRMFRRGKGKFANQHVHEKLQIEGKIGMLRHDMLHYSYLNISQFLRKFDFYSSFEAGFMLEQNVQVNALNHLRYFLLKPLVRFLRRYFLKGGFRDGIPGFFCAFFDAANIIVRYFKLWELKRQQKN
ncbi:MAG: b-1,4-glucosyltransferase [Deltaproteobacteria bacterium]|nr:b-1,4-glucosyltransferase [Deltaproteobacteria bacterium]